ncbi:hypothetical protein FRACYDRAFT_216987 [Fragilariopsis cylindrus CCMP1102]|uniref:Uncharacterized protein n=1 Tax=Fragilariopsis cylindrus CCMP1102 TaxID=635003 RepID=A0A1E7FP42_9STRA|nr:hypothetical protein FRACYDRAFT_216987 [Fragilariopsis cylindrus CCMP1102]|eukprot:OEU19907.1 hypothetical protein FRACYDRAFT_216987 [Fragilariopsis cylindrus CCMP1102]
MVNTSVPVLYLSLYYSIRNPLLLCTSCGDPKFTFPSLYNLTEFSPNDQITLKILLPIERTEIFNSSDTFVLNRLISMEVRSNEFPLSC